MIEIKKPGSISALNLIKTTIIIDDVELNAGVQSAPYDFTNTPILFITLQNNTSTDFVTLHLSDAVGRTITHNVPLQSTAYSISFSGNAAGQPLTLTDLVNLNAVRVDWSFIGFIAGSITINIYTFAI